MDVNKLDIGHGEPWPANLLSNMFPHSFEYSGKRYTSMEAFVQSLKFEDVDEANRISQLDNFEARKEGQKGNGWKKHQHLFWNGSAFERQSEIYYELLMDAYENCYDQNPLLRLGVELTKNFDLVHSIGYNDPTQTVLTENEFISYLNHLRKKKIMTNWKTEFDNLCQEMAVIDTETTGIIATESEIIELAFLHSEIEQPELIRFRPIKPIPPEASAVHHITFKMVKNEKTFGQALDTVNERLMSKKVGFYVAHNSQFDQQMLVESANRDGDSDMAEQFSSTRWICTWRLAKAILGIDYSKFQYNLSYLRYALNLDIPDDVAAHRGEADVLVCYKLLEKLVEMAYDSKLIYEDAPLGDQLYDLCWAPKKVATWPMGKYKGQKLEDIPTSFYTWAIDNIDMLNEEHERYDIDLATSVITVLEGRLT